MKGNRYLVPKTFKILQVVDQIRKEAKLKKDQTLFLFALKKEKTHILNHDQLMAEVYSKYKDDDGFLYMLYSEISAFGGLDS